ncbi:MAG: restriction endonuclease [Gammaproteobacteria bacterium]|nr:restriction endonuclease [Gammaproteobacteria bacterium]
MQRGEPRLAQFEEIDRSLSNLLRLFGPPNKVHHAEYPFGRLRNEGLWEIPDEAGLPITSAGDLHKRTLLRERIKGGLPESIYRMLLSDRELITSTAQLLLEGHFPASLHDDIREAVGLSWERMVRDALVARDPNFRSAVLRAYERRCAVCDYDIRLGDDLLGLEAAHIKWHAAGGPDDVCNGLALCGFHHKALDRGAWGLEPSNDGFRILVASDVHGQSAALRWLRDFHGARLRHPLSDSDVPLLRHVEWHWRQVFLQPSLPMPD